MFNFIYPKLNAFGLDISDRSLKVARIEENTKKDQLSLASYGLFNLDPGLMEGGRVIDKEKLAVAIQSAVQKVKIRTKATIVALPEEQCFVRLVQLPPMPEKEISEAVASETEGNIPLPIDDVYYDWRIITKPEASTGGQASDPKHFDILVAATPKIVVEEYEDLIKSAGLLPIVFEPESFAIARSVLRRHISYSPLLIVDLGDTHTTLAIISGTSIRVTASVSAASGSFTQLISTALKITVPEAEKVKQLHGISQQGEGAKVFKALQDPIEDLLHQIKGYLAFYASHSFHEHQVWTLAVKVPEVKSMGTFDFRPVSRGEVLMGRNSEGGEEVVSRTPLTGISRVFLTGGGANLAGLPEYLSANLKISVQRADPFINIVPPAKHKTGIFSFDALTFSTVFGLAMRKPESFL
ncbi:MAG: Type IV pilus assembly protein PilM [Parcubacteria group bacterium GW2011_GWA2_40_8]|uniref:SHS2 domain-containing protein n=1 Tax=Candidatus Terrybacteria bacterium RIFCSPLOWO2_01_FULL_40_23 TaxID=1802366 RepID=A0A1G2PQW5_9BACT|nr:MAG: Type IV pilus assembly protein PilM [Parcubacteria group bacterium GW2011_GWB1_40_14]KKR78002.1 MAG: Type IV pilus assembly protein PilM [Parcubacteria group bacterium GW2011_GWA2_40_8]OHA50693.1 MAG: hypothetical protein A3A97_02105 [Candidatus Terrybacteria bacterium RIFCSPLOWO2_01_FULL_40_23]